MTTQPTVDEIVHKINNDNQSLSLAEKFIDLIRPYNLNDTQAMHLFTQVKMQMSTTANFVFNTTSVSSQSSWALLPC